MLLETTLSDVQLRALDYLLDRPYSRRSQVGYALYGGGVGAKSNRAREGGVVLSRLLKAGLVAWELDKNDNQVFFLTVQGHQALKVNRHGFGV